MGGGGSGVHVITVLTGEARFSRMVAGVRLSYAGPRFEILYVFGIPLDLV